LADPYHYRAFISYSRVDRAKAKLLQARLEHFVLPQAIRIIKPGVRYDSHPLKPVFRDEDELVPGQDLPTRIRLGLERSEYLIVVCSPRAVASEWVNKEILDFIALGGRDRVLAVVVDGEPNATARGLAEMECLPAALRFEADVRQDADGRMVAEASTRAAEPLWMDWRNGVHTDRTAFLRLVAALLSLASLDELINRDRAYRRRKALFAWMGGIAIAAAILCFSVMLGLQTHRDAVKNSNTLVGLARRAATDGDWESSARYALLGMKGADYPLIGFDARTAEDGLAGSLLDNRRIGTPRALTTDPNSLAVLSHDGTLAAVANKAGTVQIFETTTGEPRGTVLHMGAFDGFALSPDGTLVATHTQSENDSGAPSEFRIWDVSTGKQIFQTLNYLAPSAMTVTLSFSPDNKKMACVGEFGDGGAIATLFDLASGRSSDLTASADGISSLAFSPDSTLVAIAWPEGIQIWQAINGKPKTDVMSIASRSVYAQVAISPDDKTLAVGTTESTLIYWDLKSQGAVLNQNLASGPIASLAFSSSGEWVGVQFVSGLVEVWKAADDSYDLSDRATKFMPGGSFAFLPDGRRMTTLASGELRLWKLISSDHDVAAPLGTRVNAGLFSPDGSVLVILGGDGRLLSFDAKTLGPLGPAVSFQGDKSRNADEQRLAFSSDGNWIAYQNASGTWLLNWRSGEQWRVPEDEQFFGAIAFSPNSKTLVSAVDSSTNDSAWSSEIRQWDLLSRRQVGPTIRVPVLVDTLSFAPSGQLLSIGSLEQVLLWDLKRNARVLPSIDGAGYAAFLPDGKQLLTNGPSNMEENGQVLQLWDVTTGLRVGPQTKLQMELHENKMSQIVFLGDGTRALVAGEDSVAIWDLKTGVEIGIPLDVSQKIEAVSLKSDLPQLLVLAGDRVYTWDLNNELYLHGRALANEVCRTLLPERLSKLSVEELAMAPVLDPRKNSDACGH